jgi:HD superfamily phosphodiesterase
MRLQIPTIRECLVMLSDTFCVEKNVHDHCRAVMRIALKMGDAIVRFAGVEIDLELLAAAGLLHDSARKQSHHAVAAAKILKEMGFHPVAEIVREHMDINIRDAVEINEKEIVYLADKLVQGNMPISLEEKFGNKLKKYADNPEALSGIQKRLNDAIKIKKKLESATGRSLQTILSTPLSKPVGDLLNQTAIFNPDHQSCVPSQET